MNEVGLMSDDLALSRRGVLAGAAALTVVAAASAGYAQTGASASQPVVLITGTSSGSAG
jgi:hypothetical protein